MSTFGDALDRLLGGPEHFTCWNCQEGLHSVCLGSAAGRTCECSTGAHPPAATAATGRPPRPRKEGRLMKLTVTLNGTDENPWRRRGLKQNPFPQIARAELNGAMRQLASLDGEPLRNDADIRSRLDGWSEEFVRLCCEQFRPGERVRFNVEFPDAQPTREEA